jgi:DNA (cytosine-5)-methyltransferase 3A
MYDLSLFDGMGCFRETLRQLGIKVHRYYASEIDKKAIKIAMKNHSDIIQLGDVTKWREWKIDWSKIRIIAAGSPCQGFSKMGKGLAFDDPRSALFFVFVDIYNHAKQFNPDVKFLLENVKMKAEYRDIITEILGVQPIHINSSLVSCQNRDRYYWTNIPNVTVPEDRGITLDSIIPNARGCGFRGRRFKETGDKWVQHFTIRKDGKSNCLITSVSTTGLYLIGNEIFTYTPELAEQIQTLPIGYTDVPGLSKSAKFHAIGNGWTIEVIKHIISGKSF